MKCNLFTYCRPILHRYANEDVSLGTWLLGLEVEMVDERSMCCGTPPGNFVNPISFKKIDENYSLFLNSINIFT
jgi:hypothetical protein